MTLKVVCKGWVGLHETPVVLVDGPESPVSDGMCDACQAELNRQMDLIEAGQQLVPETAVIR